MADRGPPAGQKADAADDRTVAGALSALLVTVRQLIGDLLQLVTLEARLAALSTVLMLALGMAVALLWITAWLLLLGALAIWLVGQGLSESTALTGIAVMNLLLSVPLLILIRRYSRDVLFTATRRQFRGTLPQKEE